MGLIMLQLLRAAGAAQVIVTDAIPFRLELAKKFGAGMPSMLRKETLSRRYEISSGWSGRCRGGNRYPSAFQNACDVLKEGGALVVIGMFSKKVKKWISLFCITRSRLSMDQKGEKRDTKKPPASGGQETSNHSDDHPSVST